jgi:hypothetical protein
MSQYSQTNLEFDTNHNFRYIHFYLKYFSFLCGLSMSSILIVGRLRTPLSPVRRSSFLPSVLFVASLSISIYIGAWNLGPTNLSIVSVSLHSYPFSMFSIHSETNQTKPSSYSIDPPALSILPSPSLQTTTATIGFLSRSTVD